MTQVVLEKMDLTEAMLEAWRRNLEAMGWARDQGDKMLKVWAEQGKITQAEAEKLMDRAVELATRQQEEMQKFVQSSLQLSLAALRLPTCEEVEALKTQVAELQAKVEALTKKAK